MNALQAPHRPVIDPLRLAEVRRYAATGVARSVRLAAGLSLNDVAIALGVTAPTVMHWESGKSRPSGTTALAYLELLHGLAGLLARRAQHEA